MGFGRVGRTKWVQSDWLCFKFNSAEAERAEDVELTD